MADGGLALRVLGSGGGVDDGDGVNFGLGGGFLSLGENFVCLVLDALGLVGGEVGDVGVVIDAAGLVAKEFSFGAGGDY